MDMVIVGRFLISAILGGADFILCIQGGFFLLEFGEQRFGFQQTVGQQPRCQFHRKGMAVEQFDHLSDLALLPFRWRKELPNQFQKGIRLQLSHLQRNKVFIPAAGSE